MLPPGFHGRGMLPRFLDEGGPQVARIDRFSLSRL